MEKITRETIKKKNKRRNSFIILTRITLCIAIVTTVVMVSYNLAIKSIPASVYSHENKENVMSDQVNQVSQVQSDSKVDSFAGVPLRNDDKGIPVICYHSISDNPSSKSPIILSKEKFREQLKTIKDNGYITLTMAQLNDYLFKDKPIPEKSVVITFDDGYRDNYTNAFTILKEFNMNATMFVIVSYLSDNLYLSAEEIKEMSDYGIDIESHTVLHKKLSTMTYANQLKELKNSKNILESITNKPVIAVAYPEGKYNNDTKKAVLEAGYSMGFTIQRGYADRGDNCAELNRICIDYTYNPNNTLNILKNLKK